MPDTYNLKAFCSNCEFRGNVEIPRGTPFEKHPCPTCGVAGITKDINVDLGNGGNYYDSGFGL